MDQIPGNEALDGTTGHLHGSKTGHHRGTEDTGMSGQGEWTVISLLALITGLLAGIMIGWNARGSTTSDQYLRSLVEKHEASTKYWDTKTNEIITNNTLERKGNGKKKD